MNSNEKKSKKTIIIVLYSATVHIVQIIKFISYKQQKKNKLLLLL